MKKLLAAALALCMLALAACAPKAAYRKITAEEAYRMMREADDYILLDTRTEEEYADKHIEGALLIPEYEIGARAAAALPDRHALILVYCRSGRRSEIAARELVGLGYTNVYDFGGIIDWPYETGGPTMSKLEKMEDIIVYADGGYSAFPSIVRTTDGNYLLAFRHAPGPDGNSHLDPESATWLMNSPDGQDWGEPRELRRPNGYAAQDPVLNVLEDGTVLMTVFFWRFTGAEQRQLLERTLPDGIDMHSIRGMTAYFGGSYSYISRDHGESWDGPFPITENYAIRGRCVELPDKTILAPMYARAGIVLFASRDGGLTWEPYSFVAGPLGKSKTAHEPALFRTQSGRVFCFIRTNEEMYYCVSEDNGLTFGAPVATGLPGSVPYDALQLPGGNVVLAYGQRKEPYGIRALLLDGEGNGISPGREIVLRDDGLGSDISYVSSAVLPEGDILTVYYYYTDENDQRRHIAGTVLRETEGD